MKTFVVFKPTADSQLVAIDVTGLSATQIDNKVKGVNWFGCSANTEQEAVDIVSASNFKYKSASEMSNLKSRLDEFKQ